MRTAREVANVEGPMRESGCAGEPMTVAMRNLFAAGAAFLVVQGGAPAVVALAFAQAPKGLCMNYGHGSYMHDLTPDGQVAQDLRRLKNGGIGCIRIAYNEFNDPQSEALALFAGALMLAGIGGPFFRAGIRKIFRSIRR